MLNSKGVEMNKIMLVHRNAKHSLNHAGLLLLRIIELAKPAVTPPMMQIFLRKKYHIENKLF
jgi:hypothetical protein